MLFRKSDKFSFKDASVFNILANPSIEKTVIEIEIGEDSDKKWKVFSVRIPAKF
jgi:hypothetical protein